MTRSRVTWLSPNDPPDAFPDISLALREPDGLLAVGGDLSSARLLAAYRQGIFPWYEEKQPILWWSPDPRCVLAPQDLHVSRRLARQIRSTSMTLTFNRSFAEVIEACAGPRRSQQGTWITSDMAQAYLRLHDEGWAHSVEVWDGEQLAGGIYGVSIGRVFFGESMFSAVSNASKIALLGLTRHMLASGMHLIDCQVASQHLTTLGAGMMPRTEFRRILDCACQPLAAHADWPARRLAVARYCAG